ncbi:MAG: tetratricopeptide repeat protein [Deltaproteobacteria bacterium]|nr:tetratricopeptide repeat protein [Deltaproteobacteria bacterium]
MLLALAVKESAVVVPIAIALWVASEPGICDPGRAAIRAGAGHALALLVGLAALLALPAYRGLVGTSLATRGPVENLVAQIDAIGFLAGQLVRFDQLNADPALEALTRLDPARALAGAAIVAVLLAALTGLRRWPLPAFAVLWTFVWLAPTNSLVARLDLVNDRQLYAALLGPALLVAWSGDALMRRGVPARLRSITRVLVVAGLALGLGLATHRRNDVYRDELVFWQDVTRKSPHNARGFNNLGFAWAEQCRLDEAELAWRRALALDPGLVRAAVNLRLLEEGAGQAERCRATAGRSAAERESRRNPPTSSRPLSRPRRSPPP